MGRSSFSKDSTLQWSHSYQPYFSWSQTYFGFKRTILYQPGFIFHVDNSSFYLAWALILPFCPFQRPHLYLHSLWNSALFPPSHATFNTKYQAINEASCSLCSFTYKTCSFFLLIRICHCVLVTQVLIIKFWLD